MGYATILSACVLLAAVVTYASAASCTNNEFACKDGKQCIDLLDLCDGKAQCNDRSDEKNCDENRCIVRRGKKMRPFANGLEHVKVPCKYPAVKQTRCGQWQVTITPEHVLWAGVRPKSYIVKSVRVAAERIPDGKKWEGRIRVATTKKYINGREESPFEQGEKSKLDVHEVFRFKAEETEDGVTAYERRGQFKIFFGAFESGDTWSRRSGWSFTCLDDKFEPSSIDFEICGNGTDNEIETLKRERGWTGSLDDRQAVIFWKIMSDQSVKQSNKRCKDTQRIMKRRCNNDEDRMQAARLCWKLVAKDRFIGCVMDNLEEPEDAMKWCTQFVCSGMTDKASCKKLGNAIDRCQELNTLSIAVRKTCKPKLRINN